MTTPPTGRDEMPEEIAECLADARESRYDYFAPRARCRRTITWLADSRDRLQPALEKAERERDAAWYCLVFFKSVIRSAEAWSPTCEAEYEKARRPSHPRQ